MCLRLQESDPCSHLGRQVDILIVLRERAHKGGVMSTDCGNVTPSSRAEFWVAVAGSLGQHLGKEKGEEEEQERV